MKSFSPKNPLPRAAAIHDLSGYGRSSLTIVIPVLASMGVNVSPLPTAILSSQTDGFDDYSFLDLTDNLSAMIKHWKSLKINFDLIYSGFLGSPEQTDLVGDFIDSFRKKKQIVLVDPVLGDNGELYGPFNQKMTAAMKELTQYADLITPNLTEAFLLLGKPYKKTLTRSEARDLLLELCETGPGTIVITGVQFEKEVSSMAVLAYNDTDGRFWKVNSERLQGSYPGTGDLFASLLAGFLLSGDSLAISVDKAVSFISQTLKISFSYRTPTREGILLEKCLPLLYNGFPEPKYELF